MAKDFIPNKLSFEVDNCLALIESIYNIYLDELSNQLIAIVQKEIWKNGNGSRLMRLSAAAEVKETLREITKNRINLNVGIDTDELKAGREDVYVRVSVVLHGNINGSRTWRDAAKLWTKPGQDTYKKHVLNKGPSTAKTMHMLPDGFVQTDVSADITTNVSKNVEQQAAKFVNQFGRNVEKALNSIDWSAFLTVS